MAKGKSVCIYGAKGGIGKTTFVLSLAGTLSNQNKSVLIVDLDLCNGGIACALNKDVKNTLYNFCDDYNNNRYEDMENYITKYNENISFIAAPKDPRSASKIDSKFIDILVDKCSFLFDAILIDTTHALDEINVFTFDKCDYVYFMTSNDPLSLKNLKNILNIFDDNNVSKYKIILNNSVILNKEYFSLYDIKNILSHNVDYVLSSNFHVKKIDSITLSGDIITLKYQNFKDYKIFNLIIDDILGGDQSE